MAHDVKISVVGAGLAGTEATLVLAGLFDNFFDKYQVRISIDLYEMRDKVQTCVHKTSMCSELVCSNSLKSLKRESAAGMLKLELAKLGSPTLSAALNNRIDAGGALAVDRNHFSEEMTRMVQSCKFINYLCEEIKDLSKLKSQYDYLVLATGPLTSKDLSEQLVKITGNVNLAFYDAAAPIVMADSINFSKVFNQNRYSDDAGDYLNAVLTKAEYEHFINNLIRADRVIDKAISKKELFQACQPIEEVAKTGLDSLRFGALKPVGIVDPKTGKRPWAVVQLRAENSNKTAYNLVGFQTNLKFSEQKRVFGFIPGLENAEYARYGVMHRNTFLNAPQLLNSEFMLKNTDNIFIAGQLSGTEGYVEAVASGHYCALSIAEKIAETDHIPLGPNTAFGSLLNYATNPDTKNYQPMHVNFGILPPLEIPERNKRIRYKKYFDRGCQEINNYICKISNASLLSKSAQTFAEANLSKLNKIML